MMTSPSRAHFKLIGLTLLLFALGMPSNANAGYTNYSGYFGTEDFWGSQPIENGFVIAGTFRPGFNVSRYYYVYGDDVGNIGPNSYSLSVADGGFRPLGSGTHTLSSPQPGYFSGSAATSDPSHYGSDIYLFCFDKPDPDNTWHVALCTSSDPSWVLGPENRTLDASDANIFIFGSKGSGYFDIGLQGVPIPEPSTVAILSSGLIALCVAGTRKRKNRTS